MIDAKELRLGNIVLHENVLFEIAGIKENEISVKKVGFPKIFQTEYDEIFPITLTPSILEKCGFKKAENKTYGLHWFIRSDKPKFVLHWPFFYRVSVQGSPFVAIYNGSQVKTLHQLQNLAQALGIQLKYQP